MKITIFSFLISMLIAGAAFSNQYLSGTPISFDAHFHYRESNDGLHGTPKDCVLTDYDREIFKQDCQSLMKYTQPGYTEEALQKCIADKIKDYELNTEKYCEEEFNYKDLLESPDFNNVSKINLISDSCFVPYSKEETKWEELKKQIAGINSHVSKIYEQYPERVIGSCGVELTWPLDYIKSELSRCLSLPGMKGVKLHVPHNKHEVNVLNIQVIEKVKSIFSLIDKNRGFVLWHMDIHQQKSEEDKRFNEFSIRTVLKLVDSYPNAKLIIPHAFHSVDAFKILNDLEDDTGKRKNLFLDLTHVEKNFYDYRFEVIQVDGKEKIINKITTKKYHDDFQRELRRFGLDRVLFGTDNFYYRENTNQLQQHIGLSPEEQEKVRVENGIKFLNTL